MKATTINKVIRQEMRDWIGSLPAELQETIKRNVIVTGGCVTSMFLQEPVNDYDVYLRTASAAIKLAEHYAAEFDKLNGYKPTVSAAPDRVKYVTGDYGLVTERIKTDTMTPEQLAERKAIKYRPVCISENAITCSDKIQIVIRFYGTPDEVHDSYDFQHAKNYWTFKEGLVTNTKSLECILAKELVYTGSQYPLASIFRTRKFIQRHWKVHAGNYLMMALQLNEMDLTDPEVLREQLTGMDMLYFYQIMDELAEMKKENPDFEINVPYILTIVERLVSGNADETDDLQ